MQKRRVYNIHTQNLKLETRNFPMVVERIKSQYRIFGGFGLLVGLNVLVGFGLFEVLTQARYIPVNRDWLPDGQATAVIGLLAGLQFIFLILFVKQNRFLIADKTAVTIINPLLPFLRRTRRWSDFEYYVTVEEKTKGTTHEAVWLIRNGKIQERFSSFFYANYEELRDQISIKSKPSPDYSRLDQLLMRLGWKSVE